MSTEPVPVAGDGQRDRRQRGQPLGPAGPGLRADARRNRVKILHAARAAFAEGGETSMAAIARRAEVGMATLYRNFPGRRELLEAVYADEAAIVSDAARASAEDATVAPDVALRTWLQQFFAFAAAKQEVAAELLTQLDRTDRVFDDSRALIRTAARPLLDRARRAGAVRADITIEQVLDMMVALATIPGPPEYREPGLRTVLDGLAAPAGPPLATAVAGGDRH